MRWRGLLLLSLGVNIALAVALILFKLWGPSRTRVTDTGIEVAEGGFVKTNVVIRRQFFSWREVESPDYPTYIANLRDIGCPDSTIRDIILADVNQLYGLKRATEIVTADQQWWRSEPDTNVVKLAEERLRGLDDERRALLTRLLGPNWETTEPDLAVLRQRRNIALDGPVLGVLPIELKKAVRQIAVSEQEKLQDYFDAQSKAGKKPDPEEPIRIREAARNELAKILSPPQLEEYLLRYAENAQVLRAELSQLKFFNATPEEFRSLFRARDQFEQQATLYYAGDDPNSLQQRTAMEQQREEAIKTALGEQRYAEYHRLHDAAYRDAVATATEGGTPKAAEAIYQIAKATEDERSLVALDPSLTPQQRQIELKRLELEQAKANAVAMGQKVPGEPPPMPPMPSAATRFAHRVEPGENLYSVALRYGVSVNELISANRGIGVGPIKAGDPIFVPYRPQNRSSEGAPVELTPPR